MDDNAQMMQYTVLGTLIRGTDKFGEAMTRLSADSFDDMLARDVFVAVRDLFTAGAPIDELTVAQKMGPDALDFVKALKQHHTDDVLYYIGVMLDNQRLRHIKDAAFAIQNSDSLETAAKETDALNGLLVQRRSRERLSASDAANDFYKSQNDTIKPEYLSWGIDKLDDGLFCELGDFVVIGGYPSAGKTLLSLQFAAHLATKYRVGYYSLETSAKKLKDRLISHMGQIPMPAIKRHTLTTDEWRRAATACKVLSTLPLDMIGASGWTVSDIQADALSMRYQVIFVDYLGIVRGDGKSRYEIVTNISLGLHQLAQSNGITVIALQQLSRPEKEKGKPKPPSLSDFRESGQIEQDADVAMLLYPTDPNDNKSPRELKVSKNKDGDRLRMQLGFDGLHQTLTPVEGETGKQIMRELCADGRRIKEANRREARAAESLQVKFEELPDKPGELPF